MAVNINHRTGEVRCTRCGDSACPHVDRLRRRFGAWANVAERRFEREAPAFPDDRVYRAMATGMQAELRGMEAILTRALEAPLAARPDERPLPTTSKDST